MSDSNSIPQVSIIMPTYNRALWLGKAIQSILIQTYQNWELIIIDNQSTDRTGEIVQSFVDKDDRIKYHNVKKSDIPGISEYLNFGMSKAKGELIARLDDDDEWYDPDKLKKQVHYMMTNPDCVLSGGGAVMVDKNGREIYKWLKRESDQLIRRNALFANPFSHITVIFRKQIALDIGGYRAIRFVEDWDLWLRLAKYGKLYNFPEYFSLYMNAGQNLSVKNQKLAAQTILKLIKEYKNEFPNYYKAYMLNYLQYLFSYLPAFIKNRIQNFLFYIKRNYF